MSDDDLIRRGDAIDRITKLSCDDDAHWGSIVDALRTIPSTQVSVKPLEWAEETDGSGWYAVSMGYQFTIRKTSRGFRYWCFDASHATFYLTLEAAKAAAQADYEARIRSALTAQPSPDVAELVAERDELRAKLGSAMDALGYYAVQTSCDSLFARTVLARVKGGA